MGFYVHAGLEIQKIVKRIVCIAPYIEALTDLICPSGGGMSGGVRSNQVLQTLDVIDTWLASAIVPSKRTQNP